MLEFTRAPGLVLEFLAQLIQQLRQTGVGSGHHPAMRVIHGDWEIDVRLAHGMIVMYEPELWRS